MSRVCFGVFSAKAVAIDAAKANGLYTNDSEVEIIEVIIDVFEQL